MAIFERTGDPLTDRIAQIDHIQVKRFVSLRGQSKEIAIEGITRHLRACRKLDCNPDHLAIKEIIDDALDGRRVFAELDNDLADVSRSHYNFEDRY